MRVRRLRRWWWRGRAWLLALTLVLVVTAAWQAAAGRTADIVAGWTADVADAVREVVDGTSGPGAISGSARIIDGDTLEVGGERVRLYGIDAPESAQHCRAAGQLWSCGLDATRALAGRIGSRAVSCEERDRDRYGRIVGVCRAGAEDLNAWMVSQGWAMAYRRYSMRYVPDELAARAMGRGIWRGEIVAPWDWRRGERLADPGAPGDGGVLQEFVTEMMSGEPDPPALAWTAILGSAGNLRASVTDGTAVWWVREGDTLAGGWEVTRITAKPPGVTVSHGDAHHHALPFHGGQVETPARGGCVIKGNIASDGERIYHVPGGEYYAQTRINATRGERWFCTEDEARAAGWRKSKR